MSQKSISIILPVHNQADHIESIIRGFHRSLSQIPISFEIILVVNNCIDDSLGICKRLSQQFARMKTLYSEKGGWGRAVKLGLQESRGEFICYTNSARTRPQDLQVFLLFAIANPKSVIIASRKTRDNFFRRLGSLLYNLEVRMLFDVACWDINGTPKIFPRSFRQLMHLKEDGDLIDAEFHAICHRERYSVLEIPIVHVTRWGGNSTTNFCSALKMYFGAIPLWRKMRKASAKKA
jgi:glycosyltransferase involved in cell wall biosynthesis